MKQNIQTNNLFLRITGLFVILLVIASVTGLTLPRVFTAQAVTPPNTFSYQGRILNSNSVPVADANATMIFELYDASAGGTCLWSNSSATCATATGKVITLTDGLFSENLGDTGDGYAAIADSVFADNGGVYLQVTIGGETLTPRKQIAAAPYALNADTVDGIDSSGLMLSTGDTATGSFDFTGAELLGASSLQFEGATDDDVYTTFAFVDPTSARTVTFKNESGTVALLSDVGGASLFTDAGTETYLTSATDDFVIGGTALTSSPFGVDESANSVYIGEGSTSDGNIIFKASNAATGTLTYNTSDRFEFTGGEVYVNQDGNARSIFIDSEATTAQVIDIDAISTSADIINISSSTLTGGDGLEIAITSPSLSGGRPLRVSHSATYTSTGNLNSTVSTMFRSITMNGAGQTLTVNDAVLALTSNVAETSGTVVYAGNVLELRQDFAGATGDAVEFDNDGTGAALLLNQDGDGIALNIDSEATTADILVVNGPTASGTMLSLVGGNFTDDVGLALNIDVTETTATADILNIQTNFGSANNNVFKIEADGEAFSDVGFTAGAFSTNYYDASITSTGAFTYASPTSFTWNDDAANTLMTLTDNGTTGNLSATGRLLSAAHAANQGFLLPTNAGAPSAVTGTVEGDAVWDSTGDTLYIYDGSSFAGITSGASTTLQTAYDAGNTILSTDARDIEFDLANTATDPDLIIDLLGDGDFEVRDAGSAFFALNDDSSVDLTSSLSTTNVHDFTADSLTTGTGVNYSFDGLTTGRGIFVESTSGALTSADLASIAQTTTYGGNTTMSGQILQLTRSVGVSSGTVTNGNADILRIVNASTGGAGTYTDSASLIDLTQNNLTSTGDVIRVTNGGTGSSIFVAQTGNTGGSNSNLSGGAVHVYNAANDNQAITAYSLVGASAASPLTHFFADNVAFDQDVLLIRQDGVGTGLNVDHNGNAVAVNVNAAATTANAVSINAGSLTTGTILDLIGGNFTDDSGLALNIDVTETTETADILNIQTNFGSTNNNVFKIEADGEAFSDVGFTAGAFSTNFYDGSITSTGAFTYSAATSFTWNDDAANTLMTLTDNGTTGTLALGSGDITCTDCLDFTDFGDSLALDSATTITGDAGESLFILRTFTDATTEQGMLLNIVASDSTSGTTGQIGLIVQNAASTEGADQLIRIFNADTDDSVAFGLVIDSDTGTILTGLDVSSSNLVTAIDLDSNFTLYDGIRVAELSTGVLTWEDTAGNDLMTLTDGGTTGTLAVTGDLTCTDCFDFTDFADSMSLDAATVIALGSNTFDINVNSTGAFAIQNGGTDVFTVATNGIVGVNRPSSSTAQSAFDVSYMDTSAFTTANIVQIENLDDGGATGGPSAMLRIDNSDANESVLYGVRVEAAFSGGIVDAYNASAFQIDNALNAGSNFVLYNSVRAGGLSAGVLTWEDTDGNDLMTLTDSGTTGTLNVTGDLTCADCFTWNDWADGTATLDATTSTQLGSNNYNWLLNGTGEVAFNLSSTGEFRIRDNGFSFFDVNAAREVDYISDGTTTDAWDFSSSTLTTGSFFDIDAGNGSMTANVIDLTNTGTGSSILIDANGDTGLTVNDTAGGALHISNTGNNNVGFSLYSNNGATAAAPLAFIYQDSTAFDEDIVLIQNDSTTSNSTALRVSQSGGGSSSAIEIVANTANYAFDVFNDGNTDTRQGIQIQGCLDTNPTSACNFVSYVDGDGTVLGAVEGDGAGGVTNASAGSDYAELFPGNLNAFNTGDVVALDSAGNSVLASSSRQLIGAFSIAPNTLGNWFDGWKTAGTHVPVALLGQVPVNVNMEGGPIAVGDNLTISSVNGVATKATGVGYMLGTALEPASADGQIMVFIQPKWHALDIFVDNGDSTLVSEGLVLGQTATATAGSVGESSNALSLQGSAWTGASAVGREMFVQNDVTDGDNYRLSVKNDNGTEVAFINNEGDLSLSGKLYPSDRGVAQTEKYIFYDGSAGFGGDFMRTNASGWGSGSYDFAEMFPSQDTLAAGEVVVFADGNAEVGRSTSRHYDPKIAGIISTQPGFLAGENIAGHVPVALTGRVPTYVTTENGTIQSGDPLTTSSRPGYAMKATTEGQIVGYAMEGFSGNTGVITVFVRPSYYDGSTITDAPAADNTVSGLQGSISDFDVTGVLNMNGGSIISVASLTGISGIWELRHDGEFRTKGRFVHLIASSQGELVETYPTLSTQTTIELTGTAQLTNGRARIIFEDIDPVFNDIISPTAPYRVFLTADSPTNPIYAIERDNDGFVIRETNGSSNATVDWMVIAYHKDFTPVDDTSIQGQDTGVTEPANVPVEDPVVEPEVIVEEQPVDPLPEITPEPEIVPVEDPIPEPVVEEPVVEELPLETSPEVIEETAV